MSDADLSTECAGLRVRLLEMGERVAEMLERASRALEAGDEALATRTIALDRRVNQDEIDLDAACAGLIRQGGLDGYNTRLVMATAKVVTDLERIGDIAVNLCEVTIATEETGVPGDMVELQRIGGRVVHMLKTVLGALRSADADAARSVLELDDEVDAAYHALFADLLDRAGRGPHLRWYMPELHVAKQLERAGDHATNVAEQVLYLVEGRDVRHAGKRLR